MYSFNTNFNTGRKIAYNSLVYNLNKCLCKDNITEKYFCELWQESLKKEKDIIEDGWYSPPPKGMAVLSGDTKRMFFKSLRDKDNWVTDKIINWENDLLFLFCSPVYIPTGIICDFGVTLYFGKNKEIIEHFKNTHDAVLEMFNAISDSHTINEFFQKCQNIFLKHKLKNYATVSRTDPTIYNLGHSLPSIDNINKTNGLTGEQRELISTSRKFINSETEWEFFNDVQFTIEPQLSSIDNPKLPRIVYHYIANKDKDGKLEICNDVDLILDRYNLI